MYLHPLLRKIPSRERLELVRHIELRAFRRNDVVMNGGEVPAQIYCVANGLLRIVVARDSPETEEVTTDFVKRDELYLVSAFDAMQRHSRTSLVAALPSTVYVVPWSAFSGVFKRHPEVLLGLFELAVEQSARLRLRIRRVSSLASERLVGRALHELTQLAPAGDSGFDKRISQSVIASYTGLSREQVNKTMRDFEMRGALKRDSRAIKVPQGFAHSDYQTPVPK